MSEENPAEAGNAQPVNWLGGMEAAAQVEVGDSGSGLNAEVDEYYKLLSSLGRTYDEDCRVAIHEAGHIASARLLIIKWVARRWTRVRATKAAYGASGTWKRSLRVAAMPPMYGRPSRL
ncbi:hypothetical protein SAMN05216338_106336 [Bradyrhizobium sp. Rc2d]|uniref:hypothetical protein n=1 Tax=Bradyrhizobium sp. Rc2d TaxID=1855321 RepID=UPI000886E466|nr:hypothetical protein [Bradyrhizobium sp. Rc2d]SDJ74860.1 hypothetical protein SAMN05216338_106336 [Bradyrhizobium sp. Rc2d]